MRALLCALCLAPALAGAQISMSVRLNGKDLGEASVTQKISATGEKTVELKMTLRTPNSETIIRQRSTYDAKGGPIRKFQEITDGQGKGRRATTVTFDDRGANVVADGPDGRKTASVSLVPGVSRANLSEFWFLRDTPKVGQVDRHYSFNMEARRWDLTEVTYVGPTKIMVAGRSISARRVSSNTGDRKIDAYLDENGWPLRIVDNQGLTLERRA